MTTIPTQYYTSALNNIVHTESQHTKKYNTYEFIAILRARGLKVKLIRGIAPVVIADVVASIRRHEKERERALTIN